jgi:hypothetical protein
MRYRALRACLRVNVRRAAKPQLLTVQTLQPEGGSNSRRPCPQVCKRLITFSATCSWEMPYCCSLARASWREMLAGRGMSDLDRSDPDGSSRSATPAEGVRATDRRCVRPSGEMRCRARRLAGCPRTGTTMPVGRHGIGSGNPRIPCESVASSTPSESAASLWTACRASSAGGGALAGPRSGHPVAAWTRSAASWPTSG